MRSFFNGIYACARPGMYHIHRMDIEVIIAAVVGIVILAYLTFTVIRPEKF